MEPDAQQAYVSGVLARASLTSICKIYLRAGATS
jgi:hypothetical protein